MCIRYRILHIKIYDKNHSLMDFIWEPNTLEFHP